MSSLLRYYKRGGYCQRGVVLLVFIPPFDLKFTDMALTNLMNIPIGHGSRNDGKENPFAGTDYEDMWSNNPYADLYYEPSFWDNIGLSNKAKDTNAEYDRLYNEYIAGIYDLQRENEYNSEKSQIQRMRDAGLNADLLGLSGTQSDSMSPPNAGPTSSLNGQSPATSAFQTISSVLGFATSTLSQIRQLGILAADSEFNAFNVLTGVARPIVEKEYGARLNLDYEPISADDLYAESSPKFSTSRNKRLMKSAVKYMFDNINHNKAKYDYNSDVEDSRFRYGRLVGHPDYDVDDKTMFTFIKAQLDFQRQIQNIDLSSGAIKKRNEALLSSMRQKYFNYMYDHFEKTGSLLAGLLLLGQQPTAMSTFNAGAFGVEKSIHRGADKIKKFFDNFTL